MSVRPSIIEIQGVKDPATVNALKSLKTTIEMITGRGHGQKPINTLGEDANFYGIVQKINEIIKRLQSETGQAGGGLGSIQTPGASAGVPGPTQTTTLTGDVTGTGTTQIATTHATVITAGGPVGGGNTVPVITWDVKGRVTALTTATITTTAIGAQPLDADLTAISTSTSLGYAMRSGTNTWEFNWWGIVKDSVGVGETMTIPAGYEAMFGVDFTNSGTISNSGQLHLR